MSSYDHYSEARGIAGRIDEEGFCDQATAVRNAIDNGKSGTEIFMQLRFYLSPLEANVRVDEVTRSRIKVLVSKLNEALSC